MGIHAMDLARFYIGEVATVAAELKTLRKKIRVDDNALLIMTFKGKKALGYIEVGWTSRPGFTGAEIYGDEGTIYRRRLRIGQEREAHQTLRRTDSAATARRVKERKGLSCDWD